MALYVIDCRTPDGKLDFKPPQPESVFGSLASSGVELDTMAKWIYQRAPHAVLDGRYISRWPSNIDSRWIARAKTW